MKKYWKYFMCGGIIVVSIILDQITKFVAELYLQGNTIKILGDFLTLRFILNDGGAFGLLSGSNILFFVMTLIGVPAFLYMLYTSRNKSIVGSIGLCLVVGGAIGNAIDRAIFAKGFFDGAVRDFISVDGFAIFNIADSCLCVGIALFILALLFLDDDAIFRKKKEV